MITVLLAIFTAGAGAAANIAAKSGKLVKVFKLLKKITKTIKKISPNPKLLDRSKNAAQKAKKARKTTAKRAKGIPDVDSPKNMERIDKTTKKGYGDDKNDGSKKTGKAKKLPIYKNTKPMNSDFIGEETGSVWGTKVNYLSEAERAKYKISIKDGRLYNSSGELFDTKSASSVFSDGKGKAIFVMDEYGDVFASKTQALGEFHHSSFLAGKPVAAAGEISVKNGIVKEITRRSGHYMPEEKHLSQFVHKLESNGVDTGAAKISSGF